MFNAFIGAESDPNIQIFQRLSDNWNKIDKNKYKSGIIEDTIAKQSTTQKISLSSISMTS